MRVFSLPKARHIAWAIMMVMISLPGSAGAATGFALSNGTVISGNMLLAMGGEAAQADGQAVDDAVDQDLVAKDPVSYLTALDTIRAYFLAGQSAYQHNDLDAAGEMFVAPMTEVYVNLEPALLAQGVPTFGNAMIDASDNAYLPESRAETEAAITSVFDALTVAEKSLPKGGRSKESIQVEVLADLLTRAATQYNAAFEEGSSSRTWLNGYGFYKAAQHRASIALPLISQQKGDAHTALLKAMELLNQAYKSPTLPAIAPIKQEDVINAAKHASKLASEL
ncbi:MAG: hypothetical protein P1V34_02750 [Alphaproteobacteria bacterium]|nr:hypothetical protein [Alphaproteobacteria bacterium]